MVSVSPSSSSTTVGMGNSNFVIRITVTRGEADVNLTRSGDLLNLNRAGKTFVHVIPEVSASSNGTYIGVGNNDVGYHRVQFSLLAFCKYSFIYGKPSASSTYAIDLDDAECEVMGRSNTGLTCSIRSYPPVLNGTLACINQMIMNLIWNQVGSAGSLGVATYKAKAVVSNVKNSCRIVTANQHGIFNKGFDMFGFYCTLGTIFAVVALKRGTSLSPTTESPSSQHL